MSKQITLFSATDGSNGYELWVTDGIAGGSGTSFLVDINPGTNSSSPHSFMALGNGNVVFQATDASHGAELWESDGTAADTSLLMDTDPGSSGSAPAFLVLLGTGKARFRATEGSTGTDLSVTDGTAAGTSEIKDIDPGSGTSAPEAAIALGV